MKKYKALALISGGLDSMLAAKMILDQGIHVEGINFFTGFCGDLLSSIKCRKGAEREQYNAKRTADLLGIPLHVVDVSEDYKPIVINPKHGYGAHLNPCLDCKIFMLSKALQWMREHSFDFVITGEVMGQRPKSQLKHMLPVVARDSGLEDRLLRPLSAKLLAPTLPEREGWVNRELLGDISGRSRAKQVELVKKYGITEYAQPSGGCCFLIDANYTRRLRDLWQARGHKDYNLDDVALLMIGRHIRPKPYFKLIVGRDEIDNAFLEKYSNKFLNLRSSSHKGPVVLLDGEIQGDEDLDLAARITAYYCSKHAGSTVQILISNNNGIEKQSSVSPFEDSKMLFGWYV
ncbi:MAG: tRNA (5-methylaminomethyl-2-thiouridylate)-methyltransferase [Gammaproteobacteria bacterium]